ncbi:MAG: hypothetical protein M3Q31_27005 [Actinomycetota bacterium]|nr:hypothetical protein [Actinomycetota bacterium]
MRFPVFAIPALAAVCAAVFAVAGGFATRRSGARVQTLRVTERDFRITAQREVRAGGATLRVYNRGPDSHELIVVRVAGGRLPLRRDGLTVDEDAVEHETAAALEPGQPGTTRELSLHLEPGRYELLCNMTGHYMGGMRSALVVR